MIMKPGETSLVHYQLKPYGDTSGTDRNIVLTSINGEIDMDDDVEWLAAPQLSSFVDFYYRNEANRSIPSLLANILLNLE